MSRTIARIFEKRNGSAGAFFGISYRGQSTFLLVSLMESVNCEKIRLGLF